MKILLVTWYFPPLNDVAALRTGALAEYMEESGHEVYVVTAAREGDASLAVSLDRRTLARTPWFDIDRFRVRSEFDAHAKAKAEIPALAPPAHRTWLSRTRSATSTIYSNIAHIPDRQIGWRFFAVAAGLGIAARHGVDMIYASGPPFTSHLVARSLSRKLGVPWIAEYRDAWSRYFYTPRPKWRQAIDERMELATVRTAAGIVAVTEPWANYYRERYRKPTIAICNGFDANNVVETEPELRRDMPLTIGYFGVLYGGLRDPSVLYESIRRSGLTSSDVQVLFYGPTETQIRPLAEKLGVSDFVNVKPRVSYSDSLSAQRASDVLLLLQAPDDPRNVPAKLFEYLASQRPILGIGLDNGVPATLIRERRAGFYVTDPDAIAAQLLNWVDEKRHSGRIPAIPSSARMGLSRAEQFEALNRFLIETTSDKPRKA